MKSPADRQHQLDELIDKLSNTTTPEAIVASMEAIGVDPTIEADQARIDAAMAGAWAFDRMTSYLKRLRSLNDERMQLGTEIGRLKRHPFPKSEEEVEAAALARVRAPILAGEQEVVFNFLAVSVQHIRSLLMMFAASVGYQIPQDDLDFLDNVRFLRNHYEHWYSRLPGQSGEVAMFTKSTVDGEYRVRGGIQTDEKDRIIVVEPRKPIPVAHIVDVTNEGVDRIERIVRETWEGATAQALENVRAYFADNPDKPIPTPESVKQDSLISVGGFEPL